MLLKLTIVRIVILQDRLQDRLFAWNALMDFTSQQHLTLDSYPQVHVKA